MQLSVITDEIAAGLDPALDVCEELGIHTVELRTIDGVQIVDQPPDALRALRQELDARGFRVCAIASPFLKCHRDDGPLVQEQVHERNVATSAEARAALAGVIASLHLQGIAALDDVEVLGIGALDRDAAAALVCRATPRR